MIFIDGYPSMNINGYPSMIWSLPLGPMGPYGPLPLGPMSLSILLGLPCPAPGVSKPMDSLSGASPKALGSVRWALCVGRVGWGGSDILWESNLQGLSNYDFCWGSNRGSNRGKNKKSEKTANKIDFAPYGNSCRFGVTEWSGFIFCVEINTGSPIFCLTE